MKSIKSTILTFAVLATLIPSVGLGTFSFWRYQVLITDGVAHELRALAGDASSELTAWFRERAAEVRALSAASMLSDGLSAGAASRPESTPVGPRQLELYLRSVQKKLGSLLELTVSDASGRALASTAAALPTPVLPAAWPGASATDGAIVEPPRWDPVRNTATLTLVVPILSSRNELLGALSAVLDLGSVRPRLQALVATSPAELIVLAADGAPLVAARAAVSSLTPVEARSVARLIAASGAAQTLTGHFGKEVVAVGDAPRALPILVVAERGRAEVYAAWLRALQLFVMLVSGLALLVGAIAYWVGRSIVRPLQHLTDAADRIARDDLTVKLADASAGEIGRLMHVFNLMIERLRKSRTDVAVASEALQKQNALLEMLAVTDGLTGVYNRQKLNDLLDEQFLRFRRNRRAFAVLMVDIDHFKAINDTHGHAAGDDVLAQVAMVLKSCVRAIDHVARYGGEEFVVLLPETTIPGGVEVAERIRAEVEAHHLTNRMIAVTVSVGVAEIRDDDLTPEPVLVRADQALYAAKHAGRNAVRDAV